MVKVKGMLFVVAAFVLVLGLSFAAHGTDDSGLPLVRDPTQTSTGDSKTTETKRMTKKLTKKNRYLTGGQKGAKSEEFARRQRGKKVGAS
jgi:hypothetical protein